MNPQSYLGSVSLIVLSLLLLGTIFATFPPFAFATGDTCFTVPATIVGTLGDDVLIGTDGFDVIMGKDGNDVIEGLGYFDYICGGKGDDIITGGAEGGFIDGGLGNDEIHAGGGLNRIYGGEGNDMLFGGESDDALAGGPGDDYIDAGAGHDLVEGGDGNDSIFGRSGSDRIFGREGNDYLDGGDEDNNLDLMRGDEGNDNCIHANATRDCARIDTPLLSPGFISCTQEEGQLCPIANFPIETGGDAKVQYTPLPFLSCSSVRIHFFIDGVPVTTSSFLKFPGATGEFAELPLSTGIVDLGPVTPGEHIIGMQAEGQVSGCNTGTLEGWGGSWLFYSSGFPT